MHKTSNPKSSFLQCPALPPSYPSILILSHYHPPFCLDKEIVLDGKAQQVFELPCLTKPIRGLPRDKLVGLPKRKSVALANGEKVHFELEDGGKTVAFMWARFDPDFLWIRNIVVSR